jgi:hypothetical protein
VKLGPNILLSLVLAGLMVVFDPSVAERLLVSGYVLLFALSFRAAIRAVAPESRWMATFALPLAYNAPLHMGFYSFSLSVALFPLAIAAWLRGHPAWTARRVAGFAALTLLLYFLHPVSFAILCVTIVAIAVWPWRGWRHTLAGGAGLLPGAAAVLFFLTREGATDVSHMRRGAPLRLDDFLILWSFDRVESWFCAALFALLAVLVAHRALARVDRARRLPGLAVAAAIVLAIYLVVPDYMAGGGMLKMRLVLYPTILLALWSAGAPGGAWFRRAAGTGLALLLAAQVAYHVDRYRRFGELFADFDAGMAEIEPGATLLPLCFDPWGTAPDGSPLSTRAQPFLHAAGRLAAQRRAVDLLNYQGNFDYFAVGFRPALNPYEHITKVEKMFQYHPPIEFLTYPERTGGRVDYVMIWGLRPAFQRSPSVRAIAQQLAEGYARVANAPSGRMQLFRRTPPH